MAQSPEFIARVADLYVARGYSLTDVAYALGVTRNTIIGIATRRGWVRNPNARVFNRERRPNGSRHEEGPLAPWPVEDAGPPPSLAMIRLAVFDPIIARALAVRTAQQKGEA